jgi:RNA polymerase sigma-70 factor (ECF subfamily)
MDRTQENDCYRRFRATRDATLLAQLFDATAPELLRIASYLTAGDREATHDAVQATFLTAIEDADSHDGSRDVRPWLLGILANHVRKERRRALRLRADAAAGADLVGTESPVVDAERRELGTVTAACMQELPSPFREVIVLHLQHGLSAREIGEALGRPAGTVRTQIVRGLDRLRALLPAGFAVGVLGVALVPATALAAVRRSVLASVPPLAVGSSSWLSSGWRFYTMTVAAFLAVVVSMLAGAWSVDPQPPAAVVVAVAEGAGPERTEAVATVERVLVPTAQEHSPAPVAAQPAGPHAGDNVRVTLKVSYADGTASAGQLVGCVLDGALVVHPVGHDGVVEFDVPWPGHYTLHALGTRSTVTVSWTGLAAKPRTEQHRLTIEPGLTLDVCAVSEAGTPVAGALVESNGGVPLATMLGPIGRTGVDGRLRCRDLRGSGRLRVSAPGYLPSDIVDFDAPVGAVCERVVMLRRATHVVPGIVRGPHGQPLGGAELALVQLTARTTEPQFLRSDAEGRFVLDTLHAGQHALVGMHRGDELWRGVARFGSDDPLVELRLTTGAAVVGTLRDADGNPLANVDVVARDRPEAVSSLPFLQTWARTGVDGTFRLGPLVTGAYELEAEGVAPRFVGVREGEVVQIDLQRPARQSVMLRLVDAAGEPLQNWRVMVLPPGSDYPDAGTSTGADGRPAASSGSGWEFPAGSHYRIAAFPPLPGAVDCRGGYARLPALVTPPLVVGSEHVVRVPDVAQQLHTIRGELVDEAGAPIAGAKVQLIGSLGTVFGPTVAVDAQGGFVFEPQPSGRYHAAVRIAGRPGRQLAAIDVRTVGDASFGRVVVPGTGRVVVAVQGVDAGSLVLQLVASGGAVHRVHRGADGRWQSGTLYRDDYELRGWTATQWVVPKPVRLTGAELLVEATLVAHESTRVVVELPFDHERNIGSWSGTVQARREGVVLCEHSLHRAFCGTFLDRMEFDVPLPPGAVQVCVEGWNGRSGRTAFGVPSAGGGTVRVALQ